MGNAGRSRLKYIRSKFVSDSQSDSTSETNEVNYFKQKVISVSLTNECGGQ